MIRETIELLTRPLRRRRWRRRRERLTKAHERWANRPKSDRHFNPLADGEHVCLFPPLPIPCIWEERDHADIKQDAHRWVEYKLEPWHDAYERAEEFLKKVKTDLKKVRTVETVETVGGGPEEHVPFWKVPKEQRDAERRAKLKQALRPRVPRGWEEGV